MPSAFAVSDSKFHVAELESILVSLYKLKMENPYSVRIKTIFSKLRIRKVS